jgi:hypothetical protein
VVNRDAGSALPPTGVSSPPGGMSIPPTTGPVGTMPPPGASNGARCTQPAECASHFCVDGVCCESSCLGLCLSCDQAGSEGRCLAVPEGQDPDDECAEDPANSCGRDGLCDGKGDCHRRPSGTQCGPGSCAGVTEMAASTCDGLGNCVAGATRSCAPAVCIESTCGTACMTNGDCQTGFFCDQSTCRVQRAQGASCDNDGQCATGFCADGVCCGTACKDKCYSCNSQGMVGTCVAASEGADPRNDCPVQGLFTCGNSGGCNGRGQCRKHLAGTPCGYGTCTGNTQLGPSSCDGMGNCKTGPKTDCSPFVCNGPVCWTACATNDQCRSGRTCTLSKCQ